ncbi:hypothetical protein BY458DRAFT_487128 [Sporodiniella umbellata]|nr:hypothetical protein BY458DRAFT_487128 [Sporodiniella umbellata]
MLSLLRKSKSILPLSFRSFSLLSASQQLDKQEPMFLVGKRNGFLPRQDPLVRLPLEFERLESLLQRMPTRLPNGNPGLLAMGQFGDAVHSELPLYDVETLTDQHLLSALFRDYTFAASAYLLEPCDLLYQTQKTYGLGRNVLPANLAVPLTKIARKIHSQPFMEYLTRIPARLSNYKKKNPSRGFDYDNLELIRAFAGTASEKGFILNHVTMVSYSPYLVRYTMDTLDALKKRDRARFDEALTGLNETYGSVNEEMKRMWSRSQPGDYIKFRTFIMGTKHQPMFPNGIVYEGVSKEPMYHRGESGANDSMIPLADNLLGVTAKMPENPLTEVLRDFRQYRPSNHRKFLTFVQDTAHRFELKSFALQDPNSAALYLANVDRIRAFRHRHWNFTKEYIIKQTDHPIATGGSPIITWLPNQLVTVLDLLEEISQRISHKQLSEKNKQRVDLITKRAFTQRRCLQHEVEALSKKMPSSRRQESV